jgi:hypothetical protein
MSKSLWDSLLDGVKDLAPTLAGAAGTLAGGPIVGGALAKVARNLVGAGDDVSIEEVAEQIHADPALMMKFRQDARKLELEELKVRTSDTQNARQEHKSSKGPIVVSILVVAGFVLSVAAVFFAEIPTESEKLAYLLLGSLAAGFTQVLNYWLGSSVGSKEKEKTLAQFASAAGGK